jgi:hypothetical protein
MEFNLLATPAGETKASTCASVAWLAIRSSHLRAHDRLFLVVLDCVGARWVASATRAQKIATNGTPTVGGAIWSTAACCQQASANRAV